jgi:hypothetical protein
MSGCHVPTKECHCKCHVSRNEHCDNCKEPEPIEIQLHEISQRIDCLFTSLKGLEGRFNLEKSFQPIRPHKCPVCQGSCEWELQSVEECGRNNGKRMMTCKACEGKGIVWG